MVKYGKKRISIKKLNNLYFRPFFKLNIFNLWKKKNWKKNSFIFY